MVAGFDFDVIQRSVVYLFREGMVFTVTLTALAMAGGIFFGTLLAMMRLARFRILAAFAGGYVNLMRSLPLVLVIFWFFFLVPLILQGITGAERPPQVGAERTAIITFIMFEAAYFCELMRAGIQSIPRGQVQAAQALDVRLPTIRSQLKAVFLKAGVDGQGELVRRLAPFLVVGQ